MTRFHRWYDQQAEPYRFGLMLAFVLVGSSLYTFWPLLVWPVLVIDCIFIYSRMKYLGKLPFKW